MSTRTKLKVYGEYPAELRVPRVFSPADEVFLSRVSEELSKRCPEFACPPGKPEPLAWYRRSVTLEVGCRGNKPSDLPGIAMIGFGPHRVEPLPETHEFNRVANVTHLLRKQVDFLTAFLKCDKDLKWGLPLRVVTRGLTYSTRTKFSHGGQFYCESCVDRVFAGIGEFDKAYPYVCASHLKGDDTVYFCDSGDRCLEPSYATPHESYGALLTTRLSDAGKTAVANALYLKGGSAAYKRLLEQVLDEQSALISK